MELFFLFGVIFVGLVFFIIVVNVLVVIVVLLLIYKNDGVGFCFILNLVVVDVLFGVVIFGLVID